MSLAASSAALARPALRRMAAIRPASSQPHDNLQIFREINKLASEGKWDNINNKPKLFLWGRDKSQAYAVYNAFNKSTAYFDQSAWGPFLKIVVTLIGIISGVKAGVVAYEFVVPEQNRLHYKYRHHGGHGHDSHEEHH